MPTESSSTCGPSAHAPKIVSISVAHRFSPDPSGNQRNTYKVTFIDPEDGVTRKRYMFAHDEMQAYTAFKDYWRGMYG